VIQRACEVCPISDTTTINSNTTSAGLEDWDRRRDWQKTRRPQSANRGPSPGRNDAVVCFEWVTSIYS